MSSFLNSKRPPVFCPGCGHEHVVRGLDKALCKLSVKRERVILVTDIGCSGLFDTFFDTHAFHGLHGRALTYATGIKMVSPKSTVIVIMGDGGLGIGGAHFLASCRRNLDITLLILNNFNYGMTGGQCSTTTPMEATTSSGFLNELERPMDICITAGAAGCNYNDRVMATDQELAKRLADAIDWCGFSLVDVWGICPGRHLKKNPNTLKQLEQEMQQVERKRDTVTNLRRSAQKEELDFAKKYQMLAKKQPPPPTFREIIQEFSTLIKGRVEVLILGAAGQYINTMGELLCLTLMSCGLYTTLKSDYPITVLRGHSICEIVADTECIEYTGLDAPEVVICLAKEGITKRAAVFNGLPPTACVYKEQNLILPATAAQVKNFDLQKINVKKTQKAIAALAILAKSQTIIDMQMLVAAINKYYEGKRKKEALETVAAIDHSKTV